MSMQLTYDDESPEAKQEFKTNFVRWSGSVVLRPPIEELNGHPDAPELVAIVQSVRGGGTPHSVVGDWLRDHEFEVIDRYPWWERLSVE